MKVCVRRMEEADIAGASEQIAQSYKEAYCGLMDADYLASLPPYHWVPILQKSIADGDTCLVALREQSVIASAVFGRYTEGAAMLHAIYVLPSEAGKGVGRQLYQQAEREMQQQGFAQCFLEVLTANERAIHFYKQRGFTKDHEFTVQENGMFLPCDMMQKRL